MAQKGNSYYHVGNGKLRAWTPLGDDYPKALTEWAKLEGEPIPACARTFRQVAAWYDLKVISKKAPRTQRDNRAELKQLNAVFGDSPIETITPVDVRTYLDNRFAITPKGRKEPAEPRLATVRANREISLLSDIINWARECGFTDMANPCSGVTRHEETGRGRYLDDNEFETIYAAGDVVLQDAMEILSSTSQRPGDVIKMKRTDLRDGALWSKQGKTGTRQRFVLEGDFKVSIERMLSRPREATGIYLLQDGNGQPITYWQLEDRWSKARTIAAATVPSVIDAQMRDIRGKTATDVEDLAHAQELLGHKTRAMTERYVKQRAGDRVKPHSRRKKA